MVQKTSCYALAEKQKGAKSKESFQLCRKMFARKNFFSKIIFSNICSTLFFAVETGLNDSMGLTGFQIPNVRVIASECKIRKKFSFASNQCTFSYSCAHGHFCLTAFVVLCVKCCGREKQAVSACLNLTRPSDKFSKNFVPFFGSKYRLGARLTH